MPYKKPCGESNRVSVGTPGADYTTNDECLSAMKRAGGGGGSALPANKRNPSAYLGRNRVRRDGVEKGEKHLSRVEA